MYFIWFLFNVNENFCNFFSQTSFSYFLGIRMTALWMKVVPAYIYFWSNMALGHFPMVKSFSRHIVHRAVGAGVEGPPPSFFCSEPYLSQEGRLCPPHFEIRAFRIFRPSYGSASCFRSKFFLPSCPRLGDIEKDKYTWRWGFLTSFLPFRVSGSFLKPLLLF